MIANENERSLRSQSRRSKRNIFIVLSTPTIVSYADNSKLKVTTKIQCCRHEQVKKENTTSLLTLRTWAKYHLLHNGPKKENELKLCDELVE